MFYKIIAVFDNDIYQESKGRLAVYHSGKMKYGDVRHFLVNNMKGE